jgi:hypothetical protein
VAVAAAVAVAAVAAVVVAAAAAVVVAVAEWVLRAVAVDETTVEGSEPAAFVCARGAVRKYPMSGA